MGDEHISCDGELSGKVAIVTGGASGIGKAISIALVRVGVKLVVVDIDQAGLDDLLRELASSGQHPEGQELPLALTANVACEKDMEGMARQAMKRFGFIDLLVHCAGILRGPGSGPRLLHQINLDEWNAVIDTNLKGTFLCNRAVLSSMIQQRQGHIINFSSTSGLKGRAFDSVYCASKFGVVGLSEALAEEVRQYGIRVHVIMPDAVATPIWAQNKPVLAPKYALPAERLADLVIYLAAMPGDTVLSHLVIGPLHRRSRKKRGS